MLQRVSDAAQRAPEEVRLELRVRRRAREEAAEEVDRVDERRVRFCGAGEEQRGFEAADVHVEGALVAVCEEDVEARRGAGRSRS